jgi:hypothetical protein
VAVLGDSAYEIGLNVPIAKQKEQAEIYIQTKRGSKERGIQWKSSLCKENNQEVDAK